MSLHRFPSLRGSLPAGILFAFLNGSDAGAAVGTLYAVTGAGTGEVCGLPALSSLYTIDPADGSATLVAPVMLGMTQVRAITGLAMHPSTGVLYAVAGGQLADCADWGESSLLTIDKVTGAATVVGMAGEMYGEWPDITFDAFGTLYGWNENDDDVHVIDTTTAVASDVGEASLSTWRTGLASDSLGRMYVKPGDQLYRVNHATGLGFDYLPLNAEPHNILAFSPTDVLYTGTRDSNGFTLQVIDRDSGEVTDIGSNTVKQIGAIEFDRGVVTPPAEADLSVSKDIDDSSVLVGDQVEFTLSVTNDGPDGTTGVVVADLLPSGYSYVSDDGGGAYNSGTGTWTVGALGASQTETLHITANVTGSFAYTNTAELTAASSWDPDSVPGSGETGQDIFDDVTPSVGDPDIDVAVFLTVNGGVRSTATKKDMAVTLRNVGVKPVAIDTGDLTATVDGSGAFVTCKAFAASLAPGRSVKTRCTFMPLAAGVSPGESLTFEATIAAPLDGHPGNDTASVTLTAN